MPDGRHYLFTVRNRDAEASGIYVGDLESKEGFILFVRDLNAGPLWAQAFDPSSLKLSGDAFPVAEAIDRAPSIWAQHKFTVSNLSGSRYSVLVYQPGRPYSSQLTWVDRSGKILGFLGARSATSVVSISPDGGTVAVDRETGGPSDSWLYELARVSFSRFTFVPPCSESPVAGLGTGWKGVPWQWCGSDHWRGRAGRRWRGSRFVTRREVSRLPDEACSVRDCARQAGKKNPHRI